MDKKTGRGHGGDWAGYESEYGREALDFSMNVNPLGIPEGVAKAIAEAAKKADRYPDPDCRRLKAAIAAHEEVSEDWIFCGNGAADIIDRMALAFCDGREPGRALVTAPTFSEYEEALKRCGWQVERTTLYEEDGFGITEDTMTRIKQWLETDLSWKKMVFLCEPNNPTGLVSERGILMEILEACKAAGAPMIVDECFNGFLDESEAHSLKNCLKDYPDLIILKAFTKIYGMAGVRLGYCLCSDWKKLDVISRAGQPWNVSFLAEEAGIAALKEDAYLEEMRRIIPTERAWLRDRLSELGVGEVYGQANYLLFKVAGLDLQEILREKGILIRSCSNYPGLGEGWYRIAVKKHEENEILIRSLEGVLAR